MGLLCTVAEAQEALEGMNEDRDDEDTSSTYSIIDDVCVGEEGELVDEEDDEFEMTVTSVLDSTSAIPSITITMTESHDILNATMETPFQEATLMTVKMIV